MRPSIASESVLSGVVSRLTDFDVADANESINLAEVTGTTDFADPVSNHLSANLSGLAAITDGANTLSLNNVAAGTLTSNEFDLV